MKVSPATGAGARLRSAQIVAHASLLALDWHGTLALLALFTWLGALLRLALDARFLTLDAWLRRTLRRWRHLCGSTLGHAGKAAAFLLLLLLLHLLLTLERLLLLLLLERRLLLLLLLLERGLLLYLHLLLLLQALLLHGCLALLILLHLELALLHRLLLLLHLERFGAARTAFAFYIIVPLAAANPLHPLLFRHHSGDRL